jgi:hypothetical protein
VVHTGIDKWAMGVTFVKTQSRLNDARMDRREEFA